MGVADSRMPMPPAALPFWWPITQLPITRVHAVEARKRTEGLVDEALRATICRRFRGRGPASGAITTVKVGFAGLCIPIYTMLAPRATRAAPPAVPPPVRIMSCLHH
jgi:hypothetical protein